MKKGRFLVLRARENKPKTKQKSKARAGMLRVFLTMGSMLNNNMNRTT